MHDWDATTSRWDQSNANPGNFFKAPCVHLSLCRPACRPLHPRPDPVTFTSSLLSMSPLGATICVRLDSSTTRLSQVTDAIRGEAAQQPSAVTIHSIFAARLPTPSKSSQSSQLSFIASPLITSPLPPPPKARSPRFSTSMQAPRTQSR